MQITIGIDISKETVVAYRLPDNQSIQVANDRAGQKTLVRWIGKQNGSLVVFAATGAYHRCLEAALAANGTPFVKVNPRQARRPIAQPGTACQIEYQLIQFTSKTKFLY